MPRDRKRTPKSPSASPAIVPSPEEVQRPAPADEIVREWLGWVAQNIGGTEQAIAAATKGAK